MFIDVRLKNPECKDRNCFLVGVIDGEGSGFLRYTVMEMHTHSETLVSAWGNNRWTVRLLFLSLDRAPVRGSEENAGRCLEGSGRRISGAGPVRLCSVLPGCLPWEPGLPCSWKESPCPTEVGLMEA